MHTRNPNEESRNLRSSTNQVDPQAKAESDERLASHIKRIVRRVTRSGRARSLLDQYILSEAEKVTRSGRDGSEIDRDTLVTMVSHRVCSSLLSRLSPRGGGVRGIRDTVRPRYLDTMTMSG